MESRSTRSQNTQQLYFSATLNSWLLDLIYPYAFFSLHFLSSFQYLFYSEVLFHWGFVTILMLRLPMHCSGATCFTCSINEWCSGCLHYFRKQKVKCNHRLSFIVLLSSINQVTSTGKTLILPNSFPICLCCCCCLLA